LLNPVKQYYLLYYFIFFNCIISYYIITLFIISSYLIVDIIILSFNLFSISLVLIILLISSLILYNSIDYLSSVDSYLFISYIVLFQLVMMLFILCNDLVLIYFNWDYLGLISYLLINWWSNKINSGLKAVIFNRLGDLSLLYLYSIIGSLFSIIGYYSFSSINVIRLLITLLVINNYSLLSSYFYSIIISIILILFTKSAQLPFSSWLINAMNAPTPISALLHSSTMVIAGLYIGILIENNIITILIYNSLFPCSLLIIIPLLTLFYSSIKALISNDIKTIIALSTISQLSYMFLVLFINPFISLYHILVHSIFKSLLFILAGSLIHFNSNYQSIYRLKISSNFIFILFTTSILILVFSLSKEIIIYNALMNISYSCISLSLLIGSVLTTLYSLRLISFILN